MSEDVCHFNQDGYCCLVLEDGESCGFADVEGKCLAKPEDLDYYSSEDEIYDLRVD